MAQAVTMVFRLDDFVIHDGGIEWQSAGGGVELLEWQISEHNSDEAVLWGACRFLVALCC